MPVCVYACTIRQSLLCYAISSQLYFHCGFDLSYTTYNAYICCGRIGPKLFKCCNCTGTFLFFDPIFRFWRALLIEVKREYVYSCSAVNNWLNGVSLCTAHSNGVFKKWICSKSETTVPPPPRWVQCWSQFWISHHRWGLSVRLKPIPPDQFWIAIQFRVYLCAHEFGRILETLANH